MNKFLVLLFFGALSFSLQAQTATISASYSGSTTATTKTAGDMDSVGDGAKRAFMKFDLSSLPAGAVVTNASLLYYNYGGGGSSLNNAVYALSNDPTTSNASTLYTDCGDASPLAGNMAYITWTNSIPYLYNTTLNSMAVTLINAYVGSWVAIGLTRDIGGTITYNFRGYTNTANPPQLSLTYYVPTPCSNAPNPGTAAVSNSRPCTGETVVLSLNGTSIASGLSYQWQFASVGGSSWTNITGANNATYSFVTSSSFDYRCKVICTATSKDSASNKVTVNVGGVSSFPYNENFELNDGSWRGVDLGSGMSEWVWGTPAKTNINAAANGLKCWVTNLTGDYTDLMNYGLESPCLNFTNLSLPRLSFSMRYLTEVDYDGLYLEVSSDGGATWTKVPQNNIIQNTYNSNSTIAAFTPPAWSGDNGAWLRYVVSLPTLSGVATAKVRVHFRSDNFVTDEGVAFDSVNISNTFYDVSASALITPVNSCSFSASNPVKISLTNLGLTLTPGTKLPVYYQINNGTIVTDTIVLNANKLIGDTIQFTFKTAASMASFGVYNFKVWVNMAIDSDHTNDTLSSIISILSITALPYRENFETSDGGWTSKIISGTFNDFYWGTPAKSFISSAASGSKCWVTKFISDYDNLSDYALETPCLNLTIGVSPSLNFSLKFRTELDYDGCILESSINGGLSWTKVTTFTQGGYNNTATAGIFPPPQWSGSSAGWMRVKVPLISYLGQSNVKFRLHFGSDNSFTDEGVAIDSISIVDLFSKDIGVAAIVSPAGGCGLTSATSLTVKVKNYGKSLPAGTKFKVGFKMSDINNIVVSAGADSVTLATVLAVGDSLNFTFSSKCNLALPGYYFITAWTGLANDSDATNDTLMNAQVISRISVVSFPYYENFELSEGNWYSDALNGSINNEWGWNFPSKTVLNSTPNGQQCWLTNPYNNYANNTNDAFYSPCFDFSSMINPVISFLMRFKMQANNDAMVLESSINGGLSWQRVDSANVQAKYNNFSATGSIQPPKWSGDNLSWKTYSINLPNLVAQSNVQFRFRFISDATVNDEGAAIDSVVVYDNKYYDVNVTSITSPISKCGLSVNETVSITLKNNGNLTMLANTGIPVSYTINNGVPVNEIILLATPWAPGSSLTYNFYTPANLSAPGSYSFAVYSAFGLDVNASNDTISNYVVSAKAIVSTFPYTEGFEGGAKDWSLDGGKTEIWRISNLLTYPAMAASRGLNMGVFSADSFSNNAHSRLISPCFDFSTMNNHGTLSFYFTQSNLDAANTDSLNVMISVNDGLVWDKVAALTRYDAAYAIAQWKRIDIDISNYAAQPKVLVAFEAIGKQGANFAIDEISVYNSDLRSVTGMYSAPGPCPILNGNQWIDLRDDQNALIAQINPNGNNLGQICYGLNLITNSLRYERAGAWPNKTDNYYFARNIWLQSSVTPVTPVSIRFFYGPSEYALTADSIKGRTGITIAKTDLALMNYYNSVSPDDLDVLNNDYVTGSTFIINPSDSLKNGFNFFRYNTSHLGEMNIVYRKLVTGISNDKFENGFNIYPNPANQELTIKYNSLSTDQMQFSICNTLGQTVKTGALSKTETTINISGLASGLYYVKVGNEAMKFVKQ